MPWHQPPYLTLLIWVFLRLENFLGHLQNGYYGSLAMLRTLLASCSVLKTPYHPKFHTHSNHTLSSFTEQDSVPGTGLCWTLTHGQLMAVYLWLNA